MTTRRMVVHELHRSSPGPRASRHASVFHRPVARNRQTAPSNTRRGASRWPVLASVVLLTLVTLGSLVEAPRARAESDALNQRLEALDDADRKLLTPHLARGPVALVELAKGDVLPAVLVASYVEAPADLAASIIGNPADYPKFMRTLDHVEVLSRSATQTAYKWTWQTGMLLMEGENRMTAFAPPKGKPELGHRISVKSERGQLGEGRLLWRVLPISAQRSLVMLSMRVDMRDANFVMRQLDAAAKSVNRSVNIALSYVMMLGVKREAERQTGKSSALPAAVPLSPPKVDIVKLYPLLRRADLLLMELTPTGLGKLGIVGRTDLRREHLMPIISEPESFGKSLVPGSYARVVKREADVKTFQWGIGLPLIGTAGVMTMRDEQGTLAIDAVDGAMKGGKWRFDIPSMPSGEAIVVGYSQFDISKASWLIEKITSLDPVMGHGLAAATQVMLLRALRKRAHDESAVPLPGVAPAAAPAAPAAPPIPAAATSAKAPPAPTTTPTASPAPTAPPPPAAPPPAAAAPPSRVPAAVTTPSPPAATVAPTSSVVPPRPSPESASRKGP